MPSFSSRSRSAVAAVAAISAMMAGAARAAEVVLVRLDQAQIVDLPEATSTVVVGNPLVVDFTMLKGNKKIVLTGKGYGETNLIALDRNGDVVGESILKVAGSGKNLTLQLGERRESFHCEQRCEPTVSLGDSNTYMDQTAAAIRNRNAAQTNAAKMQAE